MKSPLTFLLAVQTPSEASRTTPGGPFGSLSTLFNPKGAVSRDEKVIDLLKIANEVGQVGSMASEDDQERMKVAAEAIIPLSDKKPARISLSGTHDLVYSAAPGGSSGKLFGNVVGKVTQFFPDDKTFFNKVELGLLSIALKAEREIKSDNVISVSFKESIISLFGKTIVQKEIGGGGAWKVKFIGKITDQNGKQKLVRVMETPSLFVITQDLE